MSSVEDIKTTVKQKTESGIINFLGIFVFLVGVLTLLIGPAGYFASLSDTVAVSNKISLSSALFSAAFGAIVVVLGYKMIQKRKKVKPQDLPAQFVDNCYVFVTSKSDKTSTNVGLSQVTVNNDGIKYENTADTHLSSLIPWGQVLKTEWASVYSYDAYKIVTDTDTFLFMAHDPVDAQSKTRKYTAVSLISQASGNAYAAKLVAENEKNLSLLLCLHVYCNAYAPKNTTKWTSFFEYLFFTGLFRLGSLAVIAIWSSSLAQGLGYESLRMQIIGAGIVLGMGGLFYKLNSQLRGAQKLLGSKFM